MIKNAEIKVAVKIKPTESSRCIAKAFKNQNAQSIVELKLPSDQTQRIQVDLIHDANTETRPIYESCNIYQFLGRFIEGYNVTILTYGQTGSGKTFTFEGDKQSEGIIFQSIRDIYKNKTSEKTIIKCSFIQLYNQKIMDMLSSKDKLLKIKWEVEREFVIDQLLEKQCANSEQMIKEWSYGNKNRIVASNKIHDYSSRSHSLFIITMEDFDEEENYRVRQAHFVDLAGSQRIFSPVGRLSKESIQINKSLFFLRKVILSLEEVTISQKQQYIPYRDSKLTSILKKAFGGNCLTLMIACINGHEDYFEQSLNTLQYAVSASKIKNHVNINIDVKAREIRELKGQNQKLKRQLQMAMMQIEMLRSFEREQQLKRASNSEYANRIIECIGTVRQLLQSNKDLRSELEREKAEKRKMALEILELQKSIKKSKKAANLQTIDEGVQLKAREKNEFRITAHQVPQSSRPYSQSVDILKRKESQPSTIRRKKYFLRQKTERQSSSLRHLTQK